jgi:hypothetical protein
MKSCGQWSVIVAGWPAFYAKLPWALAEVSRRYISINASWPSGPTCPNLSSATSSFVLEIVFSEAVLYTVSNWPEYRFTVRCHVVHSKGSVEYFSERVCLDLKGLRTFAEHLDAIAQCNGRRASLNNVGDVSVFSIEHACPPVALESL